MDDHRRIIKENRVRLVESLDLINTSLLDRLVQDDVISLEQLLSIKERNSTNIQQASALLNLLTSKTYDLWKKFLDCALKYDFGSVIRDLSVEHQLKRLQRPVSEAILSQYNTTEIWEGGDNFTSFVLDKVYVEPVLIKERRDSVTGAADVKGEDYVDLNQELSNSKTVFVFGKLGTGKTTLLRKLCCDWAKLQDEDAMDIEDTILQKFSFILPISFLEVKESQTFQQYVSETYEIKRYAQKLVSYIKEHQESGLLVCDEIESYKEETSVEMTQLLHGRLFPEVKMLIMSRSPSLPAFYNDSYKPIKTLYLQGFSDDGVKQYVRKLYSTEADRLLPHLESLEYGRYVTRYPAFLPMLLRITLKEIHNITTVDVAEYCKEYVAYTLRRAQRKRKGLITAEKTIDQLLNEHQTFIKVLGRLAKGNVKPEKMETIFLQKQVQRYQQQSGDMIFEFLIEHKEETGGTVYMFTQYILQEFFLSYFLVGCDESDLVDVLLEFCDCRDAFSGTRVTEIIKGLNHDSLKDDNLEDAMRTISDGETCMAELHTNLQLRYVEKYEDAHLILPQVMYLSASDHRFLWNRYLTMDGSNLVKLTLQTDKDILKTLESLNAPNLSSLTLILEYPCSVENGQHIVRSISRFPLKRLEIQGVISSTESATVTAACQLSGVEELMFSGVRLASDHIQQLKQRLQESVMKMLTISQGELDHECLFELVDAVPTSASLVSLDLSDNCVFGKLDKLADMTENFKNLRKLNLTNTRFSKQERKQEIKRKLKKYPQLELKI